MSKEIKRLEDITKIYEKLQEKLENIDENTDLDKLEKNVKMFKKDIETKYKDHLDDEK